MNNINPIYVSPGPSPTYFEWLTSMVDPFTERGNHNHFFSILHNMTYIPMIELDNNRVSDGIGLRELYARNYDIRVDGEILIDSPCSMLEFLVALASRMNYIYSQTNENCTSEMFWDMMGNIGFSYYDTTDNSFAARPEMNSELENAIEMVVYRRYSPNGEGNLFLLKNPKHDQRNVEVWYQMNQYLIEKMGI